MKKFLIPVGVLFLFGFFGLFAFHIEAQKAENDAVRVPLENYIKRH